MSSIHHHVGIETPGQPPAQIQGASDAGQGMPSAGSVDPLILAFYFLLEASNTSDHSAQLHAKQLNQNAQAQQQLNAEIAALHRTSTDLQVKYHTAPHFHYYFFFWYFTQGATKYHPDRQAIDQARAVNQEVNAERQKLTDKMTTLQQNAQIKESQVSTIANESVQTSQEGTGVLQLLQEMTYKALLRHAPQGG